MLKKIYILGGGVTGLASAYELLKHGHKVEIIEKSSMIGGLARTESWKGKPIDMGPHIYHTPDSDIKNYLLKEFEGLFHERDHWAKNFKNGKFYDSSTLRPKKSLKPSSRYLNKSLNNEEEIKINLNSNRITRRLNSEAIKRKWNEKCYICFDFGELICCENCSNVAHKFCACVEKTPEKWLCERCKK